MSFAEQDLEPYGETFIVQIQALGRVLNLYPPHHPAVAAQCKRLLDNFGQLRARTAESVVNFVRGELYLNGVPLKRLSIEYRDQISEWERKGIGLLSFSADLTQHDIVSLYNVLSLDRERIRQQGGIGEALAAAGVIGIRAARVKVEVAADAVSSVDGDVATAMAPPEEEELDPQAAYARYQQSFMRLLTAVQGAAEVDQRVRMVRGLSQQIESELLRRRAVRELATRLREHDKESYRHALGGAVGAILMGSALGVPARRLRLLGEAALLRDIGKIKLSKEVLMAGEDSEQTGEQYRDHPRLGAKLLLTEREIDPTAAIVALEHHARFDLKGYPKLVARRTLHPFSRVVAVASDYDYMTGGYPGAPYMSVWEAMGALIQGTSAKYDPSALRGFLHIMGCVPEGTPLKLVDGREGVVVGTGRKTWLCPEVAILRDSAGNEVPPEIVDTDGLAPPGESVVLSFMYITEPDRARLETLLDAV